MSQKKPVVVVGSINIDLVASAERIPVAGETITGSGFQIHPGGKGANQAVAVAKLGYPVRMIGCLGRDVFGEQLKQHLQKTGVDAVGVSTVSGPSGVATIVVANNGENCIVITPGANAQLTPQVLDAQIEIIRSAGIVLTQLEIPMETVEYLATLCEREGVPLILDPAPARQLSSELLQQVAWLTPNETESEFLVSKAHEPAETAHMLLQKGARGVVLKLGARGAYLSSGDTAVFVEPFPVKAVDTTAAGDAFNGAFAVALLQGMSPEESARFAAAAAAISVMRAGAQPSMPSMDEVRQLLGSRQGKTL